MCVCVCVFLFCSLLLFPTYASQKRISVGSYPVQEQDGLIFFWVHAEGSKPTWFPPAISSDNYSDWFLYKFLERYLPFWGFLRNLLLQMIAVIYSIFTRDFSIQTRSCVTRDRIFCHIQEIPENGADAAHLNVLHSGTSRCFLGQSSQHFPPLRTILKKQA